MADTAAGTAFLQSSRRKVDDLDLEDLSLSKRLKTAAATPINEPEVAFNKANPIYKTMCANIALEYYNSKNGTKFELVEDGTLDCYPFTEITSNWIHCSFTAKEYSSIKMFFAEIKYLYPSGPAVTTCKILEGETKVGCGNCHSAVTHPVSLYQGGFPENRIDVLPEMSDKGAHKFSRFAYANYFNTPYKIPDPPTYRPGPTYDPTSSNEFLRKKAYELVSNRALDNYNKINGTQFVLVNDEGICCSTFLGISTTYGSWIHCCFNAVDSSNCSSIKLFFAEILYYQTSEPVVTNCKIVEGETQVGCENCKSVVHPVDGYRGRFPAKTEIVAKPPLHGYQKVYADEYLGAGYPVVSN